MAHLAHMRGTPPPTPTKDTNVPHPTLALMFRLSLLCAWAQHCRMGSWAPLPAFWAVPYGCGLRLGAWGDAASRHLGASCTQRTSHASWAPGELRASHTPPPRRPNPHTPMFSVAICGQGDLKMVLGLRTDLCHMRLDKGQNRGRMWTDRRLPAMTTTTFSNTHNGRTVITYCQVSGRYESRLYVNCTHNGTRLHLGDATLQHATHKTLRGAKQWARNITK